MHYLSISNDLKEYIQGFAKDIQDNRIKDIEELEIRQR